jgi:peptidoglycan hydrolase-like protein with peptidoglycan-binding domain
MKHNYLKSFKMQSTLTSTLVAVVFLFLLISPTSLNATLESNENEAILTPYVNVSEVLILDIKESLFGDVKLIQNQAAVITSLPASNTVGVGNTFTVDVFLDTTSQNTDGVDIKYLNFNPALLEVQQITPGTLYPSTQINTYNNTTGVVNFAQVTSAGSTYNGSGTLATITFFAKSAGTAALTFDFVLNDTTDTNVASAGVDVLTSATGASYTIENAQDTTSPNILNIQEANITTNSATVSFGANEQVTAYIEYGFDSSYGQQTSTAALAQNFNVSLSNLSAGATYHYRITATDTSSNQSQSLDQTFTTSPFADTVAPSAITNLSASNITETSVDLVTWSAPGDDGNTGVASSYDIRYSTLNISDAIWGSTIQVTGEPNPLVAGTLQSYTLVGLTPNTSYSTAMKTSDEVPNESDLSNVISFTTLALTDPDLDPDPDSDPTTSNGGGGGGGGSGSFQDIMAPSTPTNLTSIPADSQITIKWDNPTDSDFVRAVVIRKEGSAPSGLSDGEVVYEDNGEGFTDTDLDNTKTYYYAVYSYDKKPNYSQPVSISVQPAAGVTTISVPNTSQTKITTTTTSTAVTGILTRRLSVGMTSGQVKLLQQMLAQDPIIYPEAITSGYYGSLTAKAIQRFQIKYNIVSSGTPATTGFGSVGPKTLAKLNEVFGVQTTTPTLGGTAQIVTVPTSSSQQSVLGTVKGPFSIGMTSGQVKLLQQTLSQDSTIYPEANTSGYYGTLTKKAVQRFQCKHMDICSGSPSENGYGLAGPNTRARINGVYGEGGGVAQTQVIQTTPITQITSSLTQGQTDAIINLLVSFGAEQSVIDNVRASLGGAAQTVTESVPTPSSQQSVSGTVKGPFGIGMTSDQVKLLQQTLAKDSVIYPEANTSGYYGTLTRKAVQRFQCKYMNICSGSPSENGYGLAGPNTRARINEVF